LALILPILVARVRPWPPRPPAAWPLACAVFGALVIVAICVTTMILLHLPLIDLIRTLNRPR
jgi:hypothetical protein